MKTQTTPPAASSTSFPVLSAEALACLAQDELHDLLAPSLPDSPEVRRLFVDLTDDVIPQARRVSGRLKKKKKSPQATSTKKSISCNRQLDMELDDQRKDRAARKLEKVKEILRSMPIMKGKPTQPQIEFLSRLLGDRKDVEVECGRFNLPNPFAVSTEFVGLSVTVLVGALAPPPHPGRHKKLLINRVKQLRNELQSRKRHRSQVGKNCEPLWAKKSATAPALPTPCQSELELLQGEQCHGYA